MQERLLIVLLTVGIIGTVSIICVFAVRAFAAREILFCVFPPPGTFCSVENAGIPQYILDGDNPPTGGLAYVVYRYASAHWIGLFNNVATHIWLTMSVEASNGDNPEGASDQRETDIKYIPKHFPVGIDIPDVDKDAFRLKMLLESEYAIVHGKEQEFLNYIRNIPNWLTVLICSPLIALTKEYVNEQSLADIKKADSIHENTEPKNFQRQFLTGMRKILVDAGGFLEIQRILLLDVIAENAVETNELMAAKHKAELTGAETVATAEAKTKAMEETKKQAILQKDIDMLGVDVDAAFIEKVLKPAAEAGGIPVLTQRELSKMSNLTTLVQGGGNGSVIIQPPTQQPTPPPVPPTPPQNNPAPNQGGTNV